MTRQDWRINIENLAASVSAEYGSEVAESVFRRYGATCFENLSPIFYDEVFGNLLLIDSDN
ncbi:MAG: hypothetical protein J5877_06790 [Clostridia bacterium]|nr:hypothetical protein [Clostridia bacterium]